MSFMLDTNVVSDLIRNPKGNAARQFALVSRQSSISIIVAAELRYGAEEKNSYKLSARVDQMLDALKIETFDPPAHRIYGTIRALLERRGQPIGSNDFLIAAHALALDSTLVTDNEDEFSRVPGLKIENWLK